MANIYVSSVAYTAVTQWSATTAVTVGTIRRQLATPAAGSERCFRCTAITTGLTGSAEPSWVITANGTTTDGGVTWQECTGQAAYAWSAPHNRLYVAVNTFSVAGDTIYVSSDHNETGGSASIAAPGTIAARTKVLSVNKTSMALEAGATVSASAYNNSTFSSGYLYMYGVNYVNANASAVMSLGALSASSFDGIFDTCNFRIASSTASILYLGCQSGGYSHRLSLKNCGFRFGSVSSYVGLRGGKSLLERCTIETGSVIPTTLFIAPSNSAVATDILIKDCDFSQLLSASYNLYNLTTNSGNVFVNFNVVNSKLADSITLPTTVARPGYDVRIDNWGSSATNNKFFQVTFAGTVQQDATTTINGLSALIITNANAAWESPLELSLAPIRISAGVPVTLSYDIASTALTGPLTNADVWVEVEYSNSSGSPQGFITSSGTSSIIGAGANLLNSASAWSGSPGYTYQKTVTFTPALSGWALPTIKVGKKSATVYVDLGGATLVPGHNFAKPSTGGLLIHPGMSGGTRG